MAALRKPADLALEKDDVGTQFVTLVVIMMTALATMTMGGALVVKAMRASWVSSVSGHMTIEIPAVAQDGTVREGDALALIAGQMRDALGRERGISDVRVIARDEVEKLVKPWLGDNAGTGDLPLPALVAVRLKNPGDTQAMAAIAQTAQRVDTVATSETHQAWLSDLRRFSLVLLMAALGMALATIACSILTVTGAVKARLAAHHADIDLLHVMGASDDYIGGQFARLVVKSVGRAALIGTVAGMIVLKTGGLVAGELQAAMLPAFRWDPGALAWFAVCPALVTGLSLFAARFTVLRTLALMP